MADSRVQRETFAGGESLRHSGCAMGRRSALAITAALAIGTAACNGRLFVPVNNFTDCGSHQAACSAAGEPVAAESIQAGITGVVALRSDVAVGPDCLPCRFTSTELEFFATEGLISNADEAELVVSGVPVLVDVDERYEIELPVGTYLVCAGNECAGVSVDDGAVATANVLLEMAGGAIFTFAADGSQGPPSFEVPRP